MNIDIDLDKILRYGMAGGYGLLVLYFGFIEPAKFLSAKFAESLEVAMLSFSIISGALIYSIYRGIVSPPIFNFAAMLANRSGTALSRGVDRWERLKDPKSTQSFLTEWGSQVSLMGCSSLAGLISIYFGKQFDLTKSTAHNWLFWCCIFLAGAHFISLYRCQLREGEIEARDKAARLKIPDQTQIALKTNQSQDSDSPLKATPEI
jgi:hypothetical protein